MGNPFLQRLKIVKVPLSYIWLYPLAISLILSSCCKVIHISDYWGISYYEKKGQHLLHPIAHASPKRGPSLFSPLMIVLPCVVIEIIQNGYLFELPRYSHHQPQSTGKLFHGISLIEFMKLSKLVISIVPA